MAALVPVFATDLSSALGWRRVAPGLGLAGALVSVVCSRSLGAVIALAVVALGAVLVLHLPRSKRWLSLVLAVVVLLLGVVGFERRGDVLDASVHANPVTARLRHLACAIEVVVDAPIAGWGLGTYPVASLRYQRAGDVATGHAHWSYLEVAADLGMTGGILLLLLLWEAFQGAGDRRFRAAALVLLVHAIWDLDFQSGLLPITFLFVGLGGTIRGRPWGSVPRAWLAFVLVGLSLVAWQHQLGREAGSLTRGELPDARSANLEKSLRAWPLDPRIHGLLATELLRNGQLDRALVVALAARRLEPRTPWVAALEGDVRIARGETLQAYSAHREAERGMPSWPGYRNRREAIERLFPSAGATPP